jgi:CPA2 family monovalent cation:H+ antiporter-2
VAVVLARFVIPRVMLAIDATNSRELFLMAVLVIGVGMAWATMKIGLSPALGAFLAGIVLADTDFQQRALAEVLPLRDVFTAFFFIIMGMLFDWRYVFSHPGAVLGLFALILIGKWLIAAWSVQLMRFPARVALLAGLGLAQFGEFGYVLLQTGSDNGLINGGEKALILCAGLLSMFATPSLIKLAPHITAGERLLKPLERLLGVRGIEHCDEDDTQLSGHVIIAGFGPGGRMLAQSLATSGVPYIVFELNAETVRRERTQGEPVYYADISSAEALHHARAGEARAIVLLINDHQAVLRALDTVRSHAPRAVAVVRCRYAAERPQLEARGAALVVVEELEASFEVVSELYDILGKPVPEFYPFPGSSALGLGLAEPAGGEEDHGDSERSQ